MTGSFQKGEFQCQTNEPKPYSWFLTLAQALMEAEKSKVRVQTAGQGKLP